MPCAASKSDAALKPAARTGSRAARAKSRAHIPNMEGRRAGTVRSETEAARSRRPFPGAARAARKPPQTDGLLQSCKYA